MGQGERSGDWCISPYRDPPETVELGGPPMAHNGHEADGAPVHPMRVKITGLKESSWAGPPESSRLNGKYKVGMHGGGRRRD